MKKSWFVILTLLLTTVLVLALAACGTDVDDGKIDVPDEVLDQLPFTVEVTGLEGVSGTGQAALLDDQAYAAALSAVKSVYYVADGAAVYAADIKVVDDDGKEITVGRPVTVIITMKDENWFLVHNYEIFHVHDGEANQLIINVDGNKATFTVETFSPFVLVPTHVHSYGKWTTMEEATCTRPKVEKSECVCGARETREVGEPLGHIDADGDNFCDRCTQDLGVQPSDDCAHQPKHVDAVPVTCTADGNIEYYECQKCGKFFLDAECTNEITLNTVMLLHMGHIDADKDSKCDKCGANLGGEGEHTHAFGEWTFIGDEPGCGETGIQKRTCVCGEEQTRDYTVDHVDENEDGKCDRCGISLDGTHTHEFGEWQPLNGSLPTCTESAWEIRKCSCGETERREVLALGHIDENGDDYCDRCREYLGGNEPAVTNDAYTREGDYIYFGSYPQTVVTDDRVKSGLTASAGDLPTAEDSKNWTSYGYYIEGEVVDYMWYIDLAYNEGKYRGVYFTSYRPSETHRLSKEANSEQDDNGYNVSTVYWFKYEPIKWRILSEANGEALILCETIIDSRDYCNFDEETQQTVKYSHNGGNGYANNYALSDIRAWLNDTFYNTAFSALQKEYIKLTTVKNDLTSANPNSDPTFETRDKYVSFLCEDTKDHIFLLSFQEATNDAYGYNPDMENVADAAREKIPTDYAKSQGVKVSKDAGYVGNGAYWWLRTPAEYAAYSSRGVLWNGAAGGGIGVSNVHVGVVPALVIRLGAEE